jgi:hypothetical protein
MRRLIQLQGILGCAAILTSCFSGSSSKVTVSDALRSDEVYYKSYEQHTVRGHVYEDFETKFIVNATILAQGFRKSVGDRYRRLFNIPQPFLEEASQKTGFFVTLFTPERQRGILDDGNQWSLVLEIPGQEPLRPVAIKFLSNKARWESFFEGIDTWSREYLVIFDVHNPMIKSTELVKEQPIFLKISNSDATLKLSW